LRFRSAKKFRRKPIDTRFFVIEEFITPMGGAVVEAQGHSAMVDDSGY
jgi:hypothetical protein